ncbi:MAG: ABC transporter ATP-binding protein [Spirochaetes bacterium]|nr:ABC transporter ATP-binding protein [Spirochaetota bacterium]
MEDYAIIVRNLSKVYKLYNSPKHRLFEALHPFRKKYHRDFYALCDVSFEVKKGETVGIIGKNGSGKSTLLKIIAGVLTPTSGEVIVNGKISSLLELGTGFNPELTGIENVYFYSTLLGYRKEEIDAMLDDILAFADIGDFAYQPMKTYSSGMYVRLAFSVAVNVKPDILIVDEALAVGDIFFQAKCMIRMRRIIESGATILFVSHDPATIQSLCHRGVLLDQGKVAMIGPAKEVSQEYFKQIHVQTNEVLREVVEETQSNSNRSSENLLQAQVGMCNQLPEKEFIDGGEEFTRRCAERFGEDIGWIVNVKILNSKGEMTNRIEYREPFTVRIYIKAKRDIDNYCVGFRVWDDKGMSLAQFHNITLKKELPSLKKDDKIIVDYKVKNIFEVGNYTVAAAVEIPVIKNQNHVTVDSVMGADFFQVQMPEDILLKTHSKVILSADVFFEKIERLQ